MPESELYSPDEIARAVGVPVADVRQALGAARTLVPHAEAVRIGRQLARARRERAAVAPAPLFARAAGSAGNARSSPVPFVVSTTMHTIVVAAAIFITLSIAPALTAFRADDRHDAIRLVFTADPGPGGGGGGGGLKQPLPAPRAKLEGRRLASSPVPVRTPPKPTPKPPEPKPDPPQVVAPVVPVAADPKTQAGVAEQSPATVDIHGPGTQGGSGTGAGSGLGPGDGAGIGPGSGGGTGGGPYRPGSGIEPPRLLREVKADYTEDARRRGVSGDVVLEIVVRSDGTVGEVKVLHALGYGLDERAADAVRQWRFAPAHRLGAAVDVVVEVSVEFKLR